MTQSVQTDRTKRPATPPQGTSPSSNTIARVPMRVAERLYHWETTAKSGLDALSPEVYQCEKEHGGRHRWITIEVTKTHLRPDDTEYEKVEARVDFCARCNVRRCYAGVAGPAPESMCIHPIHHRVPHRDDRNRWREVGK